MSKILGNIFSNWAALAVSAIIAFIISPLIVANLGKEMYGVWALVTSITGYFTVLDFGVNTAIVRYVSSAVAQRKLNIARSIYSTALAIFATGAILVLVFSTVFGYFLPHIFNIHNVTRSYLYAVFIVLSIDFAIGLIFSVSQGALVGLQEFKFINFTSIIINTIRSIFLVWALSHGAGLLMLAMLQLLQSLVRAGCQYLFIRKKYAYMRFDRYAVERQTIYSIYNYSIYSFIIAVALKLLFYSDSVVIGAFIGVAEVAFYAIPATLLDYLEKLIWSMISVLVPVISTNQAKGENNANVRLYILGTRYSLLISLPLLISLYIYGDKFIYLWIGPEFGERCRWVLKYLLIGFAFSFSQLIAHGILKGVGKHKILAFIMAIEALANLGMSVFLAKPYGIEGVAIGTMIPLIIASLAIILYCCRQLSINLWKYCLTSYVTAIPGILSSLIFVLVNPLSAETYYGVIASCACISIIFFLVTTPIMIDREHRALIIFKFRQVMGCS
jgi:O-antigen/teichoic acid export membrane protein